ncbi:MAG: histidine kinase [Flavobacteriaceae bacterium]
MRYLLFFFLLLTVTVTSQNSIPKNYNPSNGLMSENISYIIQDSTIGYLWFASLDKGIIRFDGNEFLSFTKNEGLISNRAHHILCKNDSLFIATDKGMSIKINNKLVNIIGDEILKIRNLKNRILLATKQGVSEYKDGKIFPIKINYQIDLSPVKDIQYFNNGFYIATLKTLWFVNSLDTPSKIVRINEGSFTSLRILNNQLFATSKKKGVQIFEANKNQIRFKNIKNITSINYINGQYWVATDDNGVYVYADDFSFEKKISKYNGLKVNHISEVYADRVNNSWLATIGNGLYKYSSEVREKISVTPTIHFENIEIDYQSLDSISINHYENQLYLEPTQNNISFSYKTVDINSTSKLEYRWKLNNNESPWSIKNDIAFANLSPGNYSFQVKSRTKNLQETSYKTFRFFINTPFYKKDWFIYSTISSSALILILIISIIFNNIRKKNAKRLKQLKLENNLLSLEQKALQLQMNPHFIFNILNGIKALGIQQKFEEMNDTINNFAGLLRGILHNSRKEEVSLQQEIDTLKKYIILEQQMSSNPFVFTLDIDKINIDLDEIIISPMLIQPFIENAIKHGISNVNRKGLISLSFNIKDTFLHCTITDNGIGYKQSQKKSTKTSHQSVALEVTKERIKSISGIQSFYISEIIEDKLIKGTMVWFRVPLKTEF